MKHFTVDFQTKSRDDELKPISRQYIFYQEEIFRLFFLIPLFKKSVDIKFHRMWIELIDVPTALKVRDMSRLIVLSHANQTANTFSSFKIGSDRFNYDVLFNPAEIEDYTDFDNDTARIKFRVNRQLNRKGGITPEEVELEIKLFKAFPEPVFKLELDEAFRRGFEHRGQKRLRLGAVSLESRAEVGYAFPLSCELSIKFDQPFQEDAVYFGNQSETSESNLTTSPAAGLREFDDALASTTEISLASDHQTMTIDHLLPKNVIEIPIYIDLDRLENPVDAADYSVTLSIDYKLNDQKRFESMTRTFSILQDRRTTSLKALIDESGVIQRCDDGDALDLVSRFRWNGAAARGGLNCFTFRLGNDAENGDGCVYIRNFKIAFQPAENGNGSLISAEDGIGNLSEIFMVNNELAASVQQNYEFVNAPDAPVSFNVSFRHDQIREMRGDIANIYCTISFDYLELDGVIAERKALAEYAATNRKRFRCRVLMRIEQNPGAYWLAIDFGTSAIVAAFDEEAGNGANLVDLQAPLRKLIPNSYAPDQTPEYGSPFLASTTVLRNHGVLTTDSYNDDLVFLAPIKTELRQRISYLVPYLKSLIGMERLPNFNGNLKALVYYDTPEERNDESRARAFEKFPIETYQILKNAYRLLLRDFILKQIENTGAVNKVVITVPNTFTPRHIDYIKSLILQEFPMFKKDYIAFISESDAVACYYIANRASLMDSLEESELLKRRTGTEYTLIYDMGAGTLDLTWLKIDSDAEGNKDATIIGRLGKATAGNYLDYVIAKAIYTLFEDQFETPLFGRLSGDEATAGSAAYVRSDFKNYIREEIKPRLNEQDLNFTLDREMFGLKSEVVVSAAQIKQSPEVREFLKRNTEEIFSNFFTLFQTIEGKTWRRGSFPLDTVVLSGRSIQFEDLQQAIKQELAQWSVGGNVQYIDSLSEKTLKSAVVQGALQYALNYLDQSTSRTRIRNRNLQARYGVLYIDPRTEKWTFKELLNPSTRPINEKKPHYRDGMTIYEYDTDVYDADPTNDQRGNFADLSSTAVGHFVQSYSIDTARDKNSSNTEYISNIYKFHKSDISGDARRVPVRIQITRRNEMIVYVGNQFDDPTSPLKLDLNDSASFKNSMWPYME